MIAREGILDRVGGERELPGIVDRLREQEDTRVLLVHRGRAVVDEAGVLRLLTVVEAQSSSTGDADGIRWALIGRRADRSPVLLAALPSNAEPPGDERWGGIREIAAMLPDEDAEILVTGMALAGWLLEAMFCPICGAEAEVRQAGWSRHCASCVRDLFPRTDPAVIVAVESADGERLLLGANAAWAGRVHSCFAGFVEAGESLETTVHREIGEEAGVRLRDVRYRGSQPWPFPRSLMIGFRATAIDEEEAHGDGEEIVAVRWLTRAEIGSALTGDGSVALPGPASIARALIEDWHRERV